MELDLRQYDTFPADVSLEAGPGRFEIDYDGLIKVGTVRADLTVQKSTEQYFCQGTIGAQVELECFRCGEPYTQELEGETNFIFCAEGSVEDDGRTIDDEEYVFYKGDDARADISDNISQAIILEIGLKPLCLKECLGRCQICGGNLNKKNCDCKNEVTDERWDDLKKLTGR